MCVYISLKNAWSKKSLIIKHTISAFCCTLSVWEWRIENAERGVRRHVRVAAAPIRRAAAEQQRIFNRDGATPQTVEVSYESRRKKGSTTGLNGLLGRRRAASSLSFTAVLIRAVVVHRCAPYCYRDAATRDRSFGINGAARFRRIHLQVQINEQQILTLYRSN